MIARLLKGLESVISLSYVDPYRDARGWAFTGGDFVDTVNGFAFLSEAYAATDPSFDERYSLPVLWDIETGQIVSNESGEILRMLNGAFGAFANPDVDLYPEPLRPEIDALNTLIYENVNNGVYEAGFSRNQAAYEASCDGVFAVLDQLEARLETTRYLVGDVPTEADWRLFPDAHPLRHRLLHALQGEPPAHRRLPEPLGLHARPVPAPPCRRDRRHGSDQAPLLHDARHDQPQPADPRRTRARLPGAAPARASLELVSE